MNDSVLVDIVDSHVHLRDPESYPAASRAYQEFGARAALLDLDASGVLMAHAMPNTKEPLTTYDRIKAYAEATKQYPAYGGIYFCYNGKNIDELKRCLADTEVKPYVVGVKIYPPVTTSFSGEQELEDFSIRDGSPLDTIAKFCAEQDLSITIHCEDPVEKTKLGEKYGTIDDETEPHFVENVVIPLCEKYPKLKFIVAHLSHMKTLEILKGAWDDGMRNLYAEITPHHLLLSTQEIREKLGKDEVFGFCHPFVKINGGHKYRIAQTLLDGEYQDQLIYGSDHAPHPEAVKRGKKSGGIPNHEGAQIVLSWFRSQDFNLGHAIVRKFFSGNAQRIFGHIPEWTERFQKRANSILFTPERFRGGESIPGRIHNDAVVNPWGKLISPAIMGNWVVPKKV